MANFDVPSKEAAQTRECEIEVSTKINDKREETTITKPLPYRLADAIAIYGEKEVFKRFIQSLVISLQAEARTELQASRGDSGSAPRSRAKYLEELGL